MDRECLQCRGVVKLGGVRAAVLPALQLQVLIPSASVPCSSCEGFEPTNFYISLQTIYKFNRTSASRVAWGKEYGHLCDVSIRGKDQQRQTLRRRVFVL
jgi:hypothetical protein